MDAPDIPDTLDTAQSATFPKLYSFRRCPYAMRARLAIAVSGIQCELREILLRDKAPEFLQASPKGTVPVVVTQGGKVIEESLDVMIWALGQNDPEGWLAPQDGSLDGMLALIEESDGPFKDALDRYKYPPRYEGVDPLEERGKASAFLRKLEGALAQAPHLSGASMGLADMAIAPFVRQFANVDRPWFDAQDWPHLKRWLETFLASARFEAIFGKYPKWQSGDPVTLFPGVSA